MKKKNVKITMVVAMLLALSLYFIGGTYARYASDFSGSGSIDIAKWVVKVDGEATQQTDLDLEFTVQNNENVVDGKIAPGVTAVATVEVDLTGTEVAVDLTATLGALDKSILGASADDVTVTVALADNSGTAVTSGSKIALPSRQAFSGNNAKYTVKITATWNNNDNHNVSDTAAAGKTLTIPVTLKAEQHIGA